MCNVNCSDIEIFGKRKAQEGPGTNNAIAETYFWRADSYYTKALRYDLGNIPLHGESRSTCACNQFK